jgi:hypothetical protein
MVLRNRSTVEATADKSAGTERHALPRRGLIAVGISPPGSNPGKEGSAIMILSSNVDLDLNGCALKETAADNQSIGVLIDHQQNVTIRNGKIQGFKQAIVFDDHTKRITWPGNDLASRNVAIQSVDASEEAPVDAERKPQTPATSEQPKSTPSASPTPEISGRFLDRYKSSPQASPSSVHHRRRKNNERH